MTSLANRTRSLYRSFLREMPSRQSPLRPQLRETFKLSTSDAEGRLRAAEQHLVYLQSQRMYVSLLERYNPGLSGDMSEQERIRLSARRVGINLPVDGKDDPT